MIRTVNLIGDQHVSRRSFGTQDIFEANAVNRRMKEGLQMSTVIFPQHHPFDFLDDSLLVLFCPERPSAWSDFFSMLTTLQSLNTRTMTPCHDHLCRWEFTTKLQGINSHEQFVLRQEARSLFIWFSLLHLPTWGRKMLLLFVFSPQVDSFARFEINRQTPDARVTPRRRTGWQEK